MTKLYGRFRVVNEMLGPSKDDIVLSVGCGDCEYENTLLGLVGRIRGADKKWGSDVLNGLLYADNNFDKIIMLEVLEHLPEHTEKKALKECYRLLKPGGTLIISTPHNNLLSERLDPAWWLRGHRHYDHRVLQSLLRDAGFTVAETRIDGGILFALWIPTYYILDRIGLLKFFKPMAEKITDKEFNGDGWYMTTIKAVNGGD